MGKLLILIVKSNDYSCLKKTESRINTGFDLGNDCDIKKIINIVMVFWVE